MWALGIGMGASCIGLSLRYRSPVLTAWSTPGAALLVTSLQGLSMNQAIGVFLFSSLLITLGGITGWFQKLMQYMPRHIAAAMLAGILRSEERRAGKEGVSTCRCRGSPIN